MIAAALQIAAAFNLVCSGTMRSGPVGLALPEAGGEPFSITYRIDLDARRWCSDTCDTVETLAGVVEGQIVLRDQHEPDGSNVITIFPARGQFTDTLIEGEHATLRSGSCRPERFTGFPFSVA
jgi:hypothetical protein